MACNGSGCEDAVAGGDQRTQTTRKPARANLSAEAGMPESGAFRQRSMSRQTLKGQEPQERRLAGLLRWSRGG